MTYKEQCEIEKLNKTILTNILNNYSKEDIISYYQTHSQQQTIEKFGLRNIKQLIKLLKKIDYDFAFKKSKKGKASGRSHENYVIAGKKSAETQRINWQNKSVEEKQAWAEMQKKAHSTENFKTKIKQINIEYQANLSEEKKEELAKKKRNTSLNNWATNKEKILEKSYKTHKQKNNFNTSTPEKSYLKYLKTEFGEENIKTQYSESRYPFACDFYIKTTDTFIELNLHWTHGGHLFNPESIEDLEKLAKWKELAKTSNFYKKAIEVWTIRDPLKYKTAKENGLNYIIYYNENELKR